MINLLLVDASRNRLLRKTVKKTIEILKPDQVSIIVARESEVDDYADLGECYSRKNIIVGHYTKKQWKWKDIAPLDNTIFEQMYPYMIQTLFQQKRFEQYYDNLAIDDSLENHYRIFRNNLSFWYNKLLKDKITHVFFPVIPHEGYGNIIYQLCKILEIPTLMTFTSLFATRDIFLNDYMKVETEIGKHFQQLKEEYEGYSADEIELEGQALIDFNAWNSRQAEKMTPYYMKGNRLKAGLKNRYSETNLINLWRGILGKEYEKYGFNLSFISASAKQIPNLFKQIPVAYKRYCYAKPYKKQTYEMRKFYQSVAEFPQEEKYIYFALHYQPEATSNPVGGKIYFDQLIPLNILSRSIPEDMKIYVKMHPEQLAFFFSIDQIKEMLSLPNVRIMNMECSTFDLISHATAVASLSGTACWECQFWGVPAILFGHSYKNVSPLAYPVQTWDECKKAVIDILHERKTYSLKDMKLYIKANYELSYSQDEIEMLYPEFIRDFVLNSQEEKE